MNDDYFYVIISKSYSHFKFAKKFILSDEILKLSRSDIIKILNDQKTELRIAISNAEKNGINKDIIDSMNKIYQRILGTLFVHFSC